MIYLLKSNNIDTSTILLYGVIALAILITAAYFGYRWIFSINRQLWNQRQQISLLIKIAEKLGVSEDDLHYTKIRYNKKGDEFSE